MSQNQIPNPYTTNRTIPAGPASPGAPLTASSPSALGVKPDARLAAAFLSQAFLWMFAGLLVSALVAYAVQSNARLLELVLPLRRPAALVQLPRGPARKDAKSSEIGSQRSVSFLLCRFRRFGG